MKIPQHAGVLPLFTFPCITINVIFYHLLAPTSGNMYQIGTRILCVECRDDGICGQSQPLPWLPLQTEEARWSHRCSQHQPTRNSKRKNKRLLFISLIWSHVSYSSFLFSCTCMSEYIHKWNQGDIHVYI